MSGNQDRVPSTADVSDEHPDTSAALTVPMRQFGGRRAFAGRISTVVCYEDNVLIRSAISEPGDGRVLVVDGGGSLRVALVGDAMVALAADNGWSGLVLNGAVRDGTRLGEVQIGVRALGSTPRRSLKLGRGQRDCALTFGGVVFQPGDTLYSDDDGILVVRAGDDAH